MKENKIEKLILNLSTRWDCSPQEAVDRLNSMNESELNKLVNSVEKHDWGGIMGFFKSLFPMYKQERALWKNPKTRNNARTGYVKETLKTGNDSIIRMIGRPVNNPDTTIVDKNGNLYSSPHSKDPTWPTLSVEQWSKVNNKMDKAKEKSYGFKQGGLIDCLRAGGTISTCKCGGKAAIRKGAMGIDDLPNNYTTQDMEGSTRVTRKNQRNRNESVTTTEQRIRNFGTPQADTVWFRYQNNTPLMDRYQRSRTYYTPTDYNKRGLKGWFRRFFSNEATPDMMRMQDGGEMEPIPEIKYEARPIWIRDSANNRMQHKIGTIRNVGGVTEFNPTIIGEQLGLPTVGEGNTGTYESRQEYLNRWKAFQERIASENKVK